MNNINWDDFKCRCSAITRMMANSKSNPCLTEVQEKRMLELENRDKPMTEAMKLEYTKLLQYRENSKKIILSDTCIEYLMEVYAWVTAKKKPLKEQFEQQQMRKGKLAERDSIDLLSVIDGILYTKYDGERIFNDYLSGLPDVFAGDDIMQASKITDIKTCWDYPIFLKKINNGPDNGNKEQVQGYCDITKSPEGCVAFTLVDMPEIMRSDFKRKMFYEGEYISEESPDFLEKWGELERSMTFGDIPRHQRVFKIPIEPFTDYERQKIYDRVKICREWLWKFDETYQNLNK